MKTRTCLPILWGLLLLAVSEFPALATYNPQTGRWLNRDPVGERAGANPLTFDHNAPILVVDPFGLSTTSENWSSPGIYFEWQTTDLGMRPPEPDALGRTDPKNYFTFNAWTLSCDNNGPVCKNLKKVRARGTAAVEYWWSVTPSGQGTYSSQGHEQIHVGIYRNNFQQMFDFAKGHVEVCMSPQKASCVRQLLQDMAPYYIKYAARDNSAFHCGLGYVGPNSGGGLNCATQAALEAQLAVMINMILTNVGNCLAGAP